MNRMNVIIEGARWSKTYISLNINTITVFKNAINETKQDIKQITLKIENQGENKNVKVF